MFKTTPITLWSVEPCLVKKNSLFPQLETIIIFFWRSHGWEVVLIAIVQCCIVLGDMQYGTSIYTCKQFSSFEKDFKNSYVCVILLAQRKKKMDNIMYIHVALLFPGNLWWWPMCLSGSSQITNNDISMISHGLYGPAAKSIWIHQSWLDRGECDQADPWEFVEK